MMRFWSRSWLSALLKTSAWLKRWTRLNGWLVLNSHRLPDQNRIPNVSLSLYAVKKATQGVAEVQEKWLIWQQYLSALAAVWSCRGHKHVIANVFCHCVQMLLECFDYIIIFLCEISTRLSGFGFFLCRKRRALRCCIFYTDNMYMCYVNGR